MHRLQLRLDRTTTWAIVAFAVVSLATSPDVAKASAVCPPPGTLEQIIAVDATDVGPLTEHFRPVYGVYAESAAACWAGADIDIAGFISRPDGIGGARSFAIEPSWLVSLDHFLSVTDQTDPEAGWKGPFLPVAVPAELEPRFASLEGHWVHVTGHFGDRIAKTCVVIQSNPEDEAVPTSEQAVEICRTSFVITSVALSAPNTDTAPIVAQTDASSTWQPISIATLVGFAIFFRRFARVDRRRR